MVCALPVLIHVWNKSTPGIVFQFHEVTSATSPHFKCTVSNLTQLYARTSRQYSILYNLTTDISQLVNCYDRYNLRIGRYILVIKLHDCHHNQSPAWNCRSTMMYVSTSPANEAAEAKLISKMSLGLIGAVTENLECHNCLNYLG